jgi:thiamine biosynthesis lipoprotein
MKVTLKTLSSLGILSVLLLLSACGEGDAAAEVVRELYGYRCRLEVPAEFSKAQRNELFDSLKRDLEAALPNVEHSQIWELNRHAGEQSVQVSREVYRLLEKGKLFSDLSDGAFDITDGSLQQLWSTSRRRGSAPDNDAVFSAAERTDYRRLMLDDSSRRAFLEEEGIRIDSDSLIRGWAADRTVQHMKQLGARSGEVRIDTVYRCFGKRQRSYPFLGEEAAEGRLRIQKGACVALQPIGRESERRRGGRRFYDTTTGKPLRTDVRMTVVTGPDALSAEALAQIVILTGLREGMNLIEEVPFFHALVVEESGDAYLSDQMEGRFRIHSDAIKDPVPWSATEEE